jgi:hypothetical protein
MMQTAKVLSLLLLSSIAIPFFSLDAQTISWDRQNEEMSANCDTSITKVWLINNAGTAVHINSIYLGGLNAYDFYISRSQIGSGSPENFDVLPEDSIWLEIVFRPEMNKPPDTKYSDRIAQLVATSPIEKNQFINVVGHVLHALPDVNPKYIDFGIVKEFDSIITKSFLIQDTGTGTLIVESIGPVTYPILDVVSTTPGDSIILDDFKTGTRYIVEATLSSYIDTTVTLTITFKGSCVQPEHVSIHIKASQNSVLQKVDPNKFSVFPNPAPGNSILLSFESEHVNAEIKIFDVLGREMLKRNISNQNRIEIPIQDLQNGIYYARVVSGGKIFTEKFEVKR